MARLFRTDGSIETVQPFGEQWTTEDMEALIGDDFNVTRTADGAYLLICGWNALHEQLDKDSITFEELCRWKPFNPAAANATGYGRGNDWVFGDALLVAESEVQSTPEHLDLFGDWDSSAGRESSPVAIEYCCQEDDCGSVFLYTDKCYKQPSPPLFCPCCGANVSCVPSRSLIRKTPKKAGER